MTSLALEQFTSMIEQNPKQLVEVHGKLQKGAGRRHNTAALNRSAIVLTVSSWQSYIEKVVLETMDLFKPSTPDPINEDRFRLQQQIAKSAVGKFSTPGTQQIRSLFKSSIAIDPLKKWQLDYTCVETKKRTRLTIAQTQNRLLEWIKIRHTIAHGNDLPGEIVWLKNDANVPTPSIRLNLVREGICFFTNLAAQTDVAIHEELAQNYQIDTGWYP